MLEKHLRFLRKSISEKRYRKMLRRHKRLAQYGRLNSVGILFDLESRNPGEFYPKILKLINNLGINPSRATILAYVPKHKKGDYFYEFQHFSDEDLNWFYQPKSDRMKRFVDEPFDLLVHFSEKPVLPLKFITGASKAKFKVGSTAAMTDDVYDFSIKIGAEGSIDDFIREVIHYLKNVFKS